MSYVGSVINYITDSWRAMWPCHVDRERYQHDAPLVPGYSMLLALAGRDVKPMSKPSDAWLLYRYSKLCGMLKYHTIAYFDPLAESVCSAFENKSDFPVYCSLEKVVMHDGGRHMKIVIPHGQDDFIEKCNAMCFPIISMLNVDLIKVLLRDEDFLNGFASVRLQEDDNAYSMLATFIHRNQGNLPALDCMGVFLSACFAKHWMHKANQGLMDHLTFARPCHIYVKTVLEFYIEKPDCFMDACMEFSMMFYEGQIFIHAFLPYLDDEFEPSYETRSTWFEQFIDRKKRHLRSLL
jgi:hypothetical protein